MDIARLQRIVEDSIHLPSETEWIEFKHNNYDPQEIGEYISALANSAALHEKQTGYIIWGIENSTHKVIGTSFKPHQYRKGNEELENWLARQLTPRLDFKIHEFLYREKNLVLFEIPRATYLPVRFGNVEYIRSGSYKKKLCEFPEKERKLWRLFEREPFEKQIAIEDIPEDNVLKILNYPAYFELTDQPLPDNRQGILDKLISEKIIQKREGRCYNITNLGGILFARNLNEFERLKRKAIRTIIYKGNNRVETIREQLGIYGYAIGYNGAVDFINDQLPQNEVVEKALRKTVRIYPEIAIRELLANAIIHQDFTISGTGPTIEIFTDRIEFTNPGVPLIETSRFIDAPPQSRNESLASFMRRINICEERGSGIDKVIHAVEYNQLPAPDFLVISNNIKVILFAHKKLAEMEKEDRIRACYQHACLKYVSNESMTNTSLRERLSIENTNYTIASRIISETMKAGLIKKYDPDSTSKKHAKYLPFWV